MRDEMLRLANGLADVMGAKPVCALEGAPMAQDERGWSGAEVRRVKAVHDDGSSMNMIFKCAPRKERCAMQALTADGHGHAPAAFSGDLQTDGSAWMAMEDLGAPKLPERPGAKWMEKTAEALADIHACRMGVEMPWLPPADGEYWKWIATQISIDHFERKIGQSEAFQREFEGYLPLLRGRAEAFVRDMIALERESGSLTLTHGDLQTVDGAHVYDCGGRPRIIDFGWCYRAPFYVDLASYFSFEDAKLYHAALVRRGVELKYSDFDERLRAAFRYNGFIYFCPSVMNWGEGPTERTGRRLLQMIKIILTGEFPERRIGYSDAVFAQLLEEHQSGALLRAGQ